VESHDEAGRKLLSAIRGEFGIQRGHPLPLGATVRRDGINFAVFSRHATSVSLAVFLPGDGEPVFELPLEPRFNRTGDIWHVFIRGLDPGVEYAYRADRVPNLEPRIHRFDARRRLIDPYGKAVAGFETWGQGATERGSTRLQRMRSRVLDEEYDWGPEHPLNVPLADSIIYEMHVRGFTRHASSGVAHPGTFQGVVEKIPYLKELGVTAVELMPVTEFDESDHTGVNPFTGERLVNFWGYQPVSFFAAKASYAPARGNGGPLAEFKAMVGALHEAGIEVILDMVFNHTGEGDERGPTFCFRGLSNTTYYLLGPEGRYLNYSGCGNTMNCNHPVVRGLILECLQYWVTEMHVDGFRFDLASILGRGRDGSVLANPPLLERIAADPVLAHTKLIAEAWDAAGLYQVGSFPSWGRWAEWNGRFRDEVRRFVKGDPGMAPLLATRLAGSPDLYRGSGRAPYHSINFVTSHDGFTLADLVAYNRKHNEMNGEGNADGSDHNDSWNCGEEGETPSPGVLALRRRQVKNFVALLFVSQGVPMVLAGDELGRTQRGNNNAYCQDNEVSWIDWGLRERNADLFRFFRLMIAFRKSHAALRRRTFFEDEGSVPKPVTWHGRRLGLPDWSQESRWLAMHLHGLDGDDDIFLAANAHWEGQAFELPRLPGGRRWRLFVDTSLPPPRDIADRGSEPLVGAGSYPAGPRSVVILIGR
jgi:glycogen operon protein